MCLCVWNMTILQACCIANWSHLGMLPKHKHLRKSTMAALVVLVIQFNIYVFFFPFVLNVSSGMQLRPVETLDLLSPGLPVFARRLLL